MSSSNPKDIALAYHEAFYRNDRAAVRKLLADDGRFIGPLNSYSDPDTFLDGAAIFMRLNKSTEIKQIIAEGNDVCLFYESTMILPSVPTHPLAAWFKIENGKIKLFHIHFDPAPIVKAKQNGDLDRVLASKKA